MEKLTTQIKLMLVVFGEYFLPDELTKLIGVNPTQHWIKGDIISTPDGLLRKDNTIRYKQETVWEFSTGFITTLCFEDVSTRFEDEFLCKTSLLKSFIEKNNLETVLNVVVEIVDKERPSIHFNSQIIKICEELGAEIDIDMYLLSRD